ncbi:MAG TPA: carboxypeptidase-like regulatory domain-containing protein [Acidobacteriota bacterium]|nr:carboxypeptidase-like regulatory domain-containing protein [Acidobacteriota bacterium]
MISKLVKLILWMIMCALPLAFADTLRAQVAGSTISGTITDASGTVVQLATIKVKNTVTGQTIQAQSDSKGNYGVQNLVPGDYEVSVSAAGFTPKTAKITLSQGVGQILNMSLSKLGVNPNEPSLSDLGFPPSETKGSVQEQARLDKRSHMLKIHQRLGLITTAPLVATVITGTFAGGRSTSSTDRNVHMALGSVTAGLYFTSATYAIFAPKIPGIQARGPIRLHKTLAWIHGAGMILSPALGAMAYEQRSRGERIHGIAGAHSAVGIVTAAAYGAAILSVSVKF